ncbi:MAG: hypothetical protein R2706_15235 [Acidimicrobiales bacterium]
MVIYRGADSKVGYHQTDDIHDAVSFVEQLRNEQGVEHARIFRLEEVNFEYRPYFRVELKAGGPSLGAAPTAAASVAAAPAEPAAPAATPVVETVAASAPVVETPAVRVEAAADAAASDSKTAVETKVEPKVESSAPPTVSAPAADAENGVSARRGLFGR